MKDTEENYVITNLTIYSLCRFKRVQMDWVCSIRGEARNSCNILYGYFIKGMPLGTTLLRLVFDKLWREFLGNGSG